MANEPQKFMNTFAFSGGIALEKGLTPWGTSCKHLC